MSVTPDMLIASIQEKLRTFFIILFYISVFSISFSTLSSRPSCLSLIDLIFQGRDQQFTSDYKPGNRIYLPSIDLFFNGFERCERHRILKVVGSVPFVCDVDIAIPCVKP